MANNSRVQSSSSSSSSPSPAKVIIMEPLAHGGLDFAGDREVNDFSHWEFISPSDADSDTKSLHSVEDGFVSWNYLTPNPEPKSPETNQETPTQITNQDQDLFSQVSSHDLHKCRGWSLSSRAYDLSPITLPELEDRIRRFDNADDDHEGEEGLQEEEEEEDIDDGYGLDDELVPWHVTSKFGRQRMRKLGKRVFARMSSSKRNPFLYVKPGCVHGKHGLGLKA